MCLNRRGKKVHTEVKKKNRTKEQRARKYKQYKRMEKRKGMNIVCECVHRMLEFINNIHLTIFEYIRNSCVCVCVCIHLYVYVCFVLIAVAAVSVTIMVCYYLLISIL